MFILRFLGDSNKIKIYVKESKPVESFLVRLPLFPQTIINACLAPLQKFANHAKLFVNYPTPEMYRTVM